MGRLITFLKQIGNLSSPEGRWRLEVSKMLDGLTGTDNDVLVTRGIANQPVSSTGTDVILTDVKFSNGSIAYNTVTGIYTLVPGRIYELDAGGQLENFSNATGGFIRISWCDTDNIPLAAELPGIYKPTTSTVASNEVPRSRAIIRPANTTEARVKLRAVAGIGTAEIVAGFFGSIIKEL